MEGNLAKSLPLVAAVLGRQYGVRVELTESSTARTDGRTVYIPMVKDDPESLELVRGYIDHEAGGHVRSTDFVAYRVAPLDALGYFILNSLEDYRVEKRLIDAGFRGCENNLKKLIRRFFCDKAVQATGKVSTDVSNYVLLTVRSWAVPEVTNFNQIKLPEALKSSIDGILQEVKRWCPSTEACVTYARRIVEVIRAHEPKVAPKEGQQSKGKGKSKKGGKGRKKDAQQADEQASEDEGLLKNLGEALAERIGTLAKASCCSCVLTPATDKPTNPHPYRAMESGARNAALLTSSKLRGKLRALLETRTRSDTSVGRRGKRLDARSLYRVSVGDGRVFKAVAEAQGLDTKVILAIDCSGSMRQEDRVQVAFSSAYSIAEAVRGLKGVSVEGVAFPGGVAVRDSVKVLDLESRRWSVPVPAGGTPLGPCWSYLAQRLAVCPERRKLVLTISDGVPDDDRAAKEAYSLLKAVGAEVLGVGIGENYMGRFMPEDSFCVVEDVGDLAAALFGLLEKSI